MSQPGSNAAAVPPPASGFFTDSKKGEVNELKELLKNINVERDVRKKRDVIKKVIAYMTLGIDVSRLFTDMMMAIETKDMVVKKMVYLYLCTYAQQQPELALMCINTLRRDCDNEDPMVRGAALRSMCSLRLECMLEYVEQPLKRGLKDISAYVRKAAVVGVLKVQAVSPAMVESGDYVALITKMLYDVDTTVITNAIYVLNELHIKKGGLPLTPALLMHLLNRIGEFSEWGLNAILDLVCRYRPANEEEVYAVMNLLDPVLRTTNSGAVLATIRCFLHVTADMPELHAQIYRRTKPPLLTFVTGGQPEIQFAVLKHLDLVLRRTAAAGIYDDDYRQLFVRYNEPPHVKHLKVGLLPLVTNAANATEVAAELSEYVTDVDVELSRAAVVALSEIAMKVTSACDEVTVKLVELVDIDIPHVRNEAVKSLGNVLRMFPGMSTHVLPSLSRCLKKIEDPEARTVLVWMLGEFGTQVVEAPYKLEAIINDWEDVTSPEVKLQVLAAAMKLLFQRPPEMQAMVGRLLAAAINDTASQDVHDRALFYYRLLQEAGHNSICAVAGKLFADLASSGVAGKPFSERMAGESGRQVAREFNTLSVIYGTPASKFLADDYIKPIVIVESEAAATDDKANKPTASPAFSGGGGDGASAFAPPLPPAQDPQVPIQQPVAQQHQAVANLLDWDDGPAPPPAPAPAAAAAVAAPPARAPVAAPAPPPRFQLVAPSTPLTPPAFQALWGKTPECVNTLNGIYNGVSHRSASAASIEAALRLVHLQPIASGVLPNDAGYKLFFYGVDGGENTFLTQCSIATTRNANHTTSYTVNIVLKVVPAQAGAGVVGLANGFTQLLIADVFPDII